MERHDIINTLARGHYHDYLEIGVDAGVTFNNVRIDRKVGVDPYFKIPQSQLDGETFPICSDDYFSQYGGRKYDCVFIDGLHTYEQSKKDFLNSWRDLSPNGIVVLDDCDPTDELASLPDLEKCLKGRVAQGTPDDHTWMGDVYKTALWINDCTDYSYSYVKESVGMVVVWQDAVRGRKRWFKDEREIESCDFYTFKSLPIPISPLAEISKKVHREFSLRVFLSGMFSVLR